MRLLVVLLVAVGSGAFAGQVRSSGVEDANRALLDSLGLCPGTVQIREYVLPNGTVGREYAAKIPLNDAPTTVTVFFRDRLLAQGWTERERHAAVSMFDQANHSVSILRAGPHDPGPPSDARIVASEPSPPDATFFFAIEAEAT